MVSKKILSLIFSPCTTFFFKSLRTAGKDVSKIKSMVKPFEPILKKSEKSIFSPEITKIAETTNFEKNIGRGLLPDLHVDEKKWTLLEKLCSRKGLGLRDIEGISQYNADMIEFLSKLPEEKLLGLRDFLQMRISFHSSLASVSCVKPETLKAIPEMNKAQRAFMKKFLPMQKHGWRVFNNEQNLIELAQKGYSETDLYKLIHRCSLEEKSIMEAVKVENLNVDFLAAQIDKIKRELGKNFERVHVMHSFSNPSEFTIAYAAKNSPKAYLKTFNSTGQVIHSEELIATGIEKLTQSPAKSAVESQFKKNLEKASKPQIKKFKKGLKESDDEVLMFTRKSDKGSVHSSVNGKIKFADTKETAYSIFERTQFLEEEITYLGKNGERITEKIIPTEVDGVHKIIQIKPDGTTKILGDAKIDPQTGIKRITRNFSSLNGTTTEKTLEIMPDGSRKLQYAIKDSNGSILMDRKISHTFLNPNEAISVVNGRSYKILYSPDKISITNCQTGELTQINVKELFSEINLLKFGNEASGLNEKAWKTIKQMSAEELLYLQQKVKQCVFMADESMLVWSQLGFDNCIHTGANNFIASHELTHAVDLCKDFRGTVKNAPTLLSQNPEILQSYKKELALFTEHFPEAQRDHIFYFINSTDVGIKETVAESGALLNHYNNNPRFSIRSEYLERYFPETIAKIEKLLCPPASLIKPAA